MAPPNVLKTERDKKVKVLLNFATSISEIVTNIPDNPHLASDLQTHIILLPIAIPSSRFRDFETQGTDLWNLATRLSRSNSDHDKRTLCLIRVFAFGMLDSVHKKNNKTSANCVRLLKVAFKAAKGCLQCGECDQGVKVLERAAELCEELRSEEIIVAKEDDNVRQRLLAEYYLLRTTLAWKQSKLDVAEHMYQKIAPSLLSYDPHSAEELADALYEIGRDLFSKRQYELSIRWLERAYDTLADQELGLLTDNAGELRLSVMQLVAKAHISMKTPAALDRARHMVSLMDVDFADKMVVGLLKLEMLAAQESPSAEEYYNGIYGMILSLQSLANNQVLERMFRTIIMTRPNFKTVMHHLHKLRKLNLSLACKALDDLLSTRLLGEDKSELIERAVIMRIWMTASSPEVRDDAHLSLSEILENISAAAKNPFSAAATHAAQTLLWKQIESSYAQNKYTLAETWCRLAVHSMFENCGELNRAKILRKIMLCALARQDTTAARAANFKMSQTQQDSPQTRYLMYKIALQDGDTELAAKSLEIVCKHSGKDTTLLYACVLESQQSGDRKQAVFALQKVLQNYDHNDHKGVDMPALLRCTTRLLKAEIKKNETPSKEVVESLCKIFEAAVTHAERQQRQPSNKSEQPFDSIELNWFSRNSYNMALEYCAKMQPHYLLRLCDCSTQLIALLQQEAAESDANNFRLRYIFCKYLGICAAVVLGRSEDAIAESLQYYLAVRQHSTSLRELIGVQLRVEGIGDAEKADLVSKHFEAVKYELEAVLRLGQWDAIEQLFQECWRYENPKHWQTIADLAFVINEEISNAGFAAKYQTKVLSFIQRIINTSWKSTADIKNLARWIRCLFQIALVANEKTSLQCIEQATNIARKQKNTPMPFPATELEWLAATSFNRAVDYYCASDDDNCRLWAERALTLAGEMEDGGALSSLLQKQYSGLSWDKD